MYLEIGMQYLSAYLDSFISITTDMGTELGIGDYEDVSVNNLFPSWLLGSQLEVDGGDDEGQSFGQAIWGGGFLFKHVITVTGMLHVFSNASKGVYQCLSFWDALYNALKVLEKLVSHPDRLRQFAEVCVVPSPFDRQLFKCPAPHLYDKRWGEVYLFCLWLVGEEYGRLRVFTQTWSAQKYTQAADDNQIDDSDGFSPSDVSTVLHDITVQAGVALVCTLDGLLQKMSAWCERCPCHEHIQAAYKDKVPAAVAREECGAWFAEGIPCPWRGCRAPEIAAGVIIHMLQEMFDLALADLAYRFRSRMTGEQWSAFSGDFHKGKSHIIYIVNIKLSQWQQLPWYLCVLGHLCEGAARRGAQKILIMYSANPIDTANHRVTMMVCPEDTLLGQQLRSFARGAARLAHLYLSSMRFLANSRPSL